MLEKIGMRPREHLGYVRFVRGVWRDALLDAITEEEFRSPGL
jgi:hypothetical protein